MARIVTVGHAALCHVFASERVGAGAAQIAQQEPYDSLGGSAALGAWAVARLGGDSVLWGRRGKDSEGARLADLLGERGVDVSYYREFSKGHTPVLELHEDQAVHALTAAREGSLPDGSSWLPLDELESAQALLVDLEWPAGARRAAESAMRQEIPVVLNFERDCPEGWQMAGIVSHAIARESWAQRSGGVTMVLQRIRECGSWGAVTLGRSGVLYPGGQMLAFRVPEFHPIGAGAIFRAAFTLALAENRSEFDALRFATGSAALYVQNGEPPYRADVLDVIGEY